MVPEGLQQLVVQQNKLDLAHKLVKVQLHHKKVNVLSLVQNHQQRQQNRDRVYSQIANQKNQAGVGANANDKNQNFVILYYFDMN